MLTSLIQAAAQRALFAMGVTVELRPVRKITAEVPVVLASAGMVTPFSSSRC